MEWTVLHPCVVDKNQERYLGSEGSCAHTRPPSPGFQCKEDKSLQLLAVKDTGSWGGGRNCEISGTSF